MRSRFGKFLMITAMLGVACLASQAQAGVVLVGSVMKLNASNFPGTNGEFGGFLSTNSYYAGSESGRTQGREDFRTFCAELSEHFSEGESLRVSGLSTVTMNSGFQLTKAAAWLFRGFSLLKNTSYVGSIGGQSYNSTTADANLLQNALWFYMGEITGQTAANNKYVKAVQDNILYVNALLNFGGVRVMNLVHNGGANDGAARQDQFNYDSDSDQGFSPVPEPVSSVLWLSGMAGVVIARRRRRQSGN